MSEGSKQTQRYCWNCGAEERSGTRFCVSCGASLAQGPEPSDSGEAQSFSPSPTPSRSLASTLQGMLLGWSRRFSNAHSGASETTGNGLPNKIINWFKGLPSTPKLILVGLVLLVLFTVLSPLAFVVAALLFGASILALITRRHQRGSVKGWGIIAVTSLVSLFVFGGISNALYGFGDNNSDWQVVFEAPARGETGSSFGSIFVSASSLNEEQITAIANGMFSRTRDYDAVDVNVYDRDEAIFENGKGLRSLDTGELYPGDVYNIQIAHTSAGERIAGVEARVGNPVKRREPGPGNPESKKKDTGAQKKEQPSHKTAAATSQPQPQKQRSDPNAVIRDMEKNAQQEEARQSQRAMEREVQNRGQAAQQQQAQENAQRNADRMEAQQREYKQRQQREARR